MSPLSEKAKKELGKTHAKFIYWAAYGVTYSVAVFPFALLGAVYYQYRSYIFPSGVGIGAVLAPICANIVVKRYSK